MRIPRPNSLPIRRVLADRADEPLERWVATLPVVRQVLEEGLDLGPLNIFVGENGAGKSTLVEAIALAFGMSPEGGSTGARHSSRRSESTLHRHLRFSRGAGSARWGFFLRAESMHGYFTHLEDNPGTSYEPRFHEMSHGESFNSLLNNRFHSDGLYVLDEPEAALSFQSSLGLIDVLQTVASRGRSQAIVATHSPIIAATPGATIFELGEFGIRQTAWEDLDLVRHWKRFMHRPDAYLRYLTASD